ncbi:protein MIX23 [Onthophagus taurus]|uniref:protein MIX23 n=1 Tax=Onthophagus taurus TaxID=166361 RepID=UPI000C20F849|nr:coiled-coil domain-containing protein 58 [Onthophagus taurus]
MPESIMECGDFSDFQDALKSMRRTDDLIINTLNAVIPTDSFHPDAKHACTELKGKIQEGNIKRESAIKNCINIAADRVKRLKEEREKNLGDIQLSKELRAEQTKLRMLQVELSVEELVKQRSMQVFNERCRKYMV